MAWPELPCRVWIGVTGHRNIATDPRLDERVNAILTSIRRTAAESGIGKVSFGVVSALAEGADRIVARAILRDPGAVLEAVLPLPADEYREDFASADSQKEFEQLLSAAAIIREPHQAGLRDEAYLAAGLRIVERSDVVIAIWDGNPAQGRGGTAEIVGKARSRRPPPPIYLIVPPNYELQHPRPILDTQPFNSIREFNAARLPPNAGTWARELREAADAAGMGHSRLQPAIEWAEGVFERADAQAVKYQKPHEAAKLLLFFGSALAVGVGALQALILPDALWPVAVEVALLVALLADVIVVRRARWHAKWLAYRALAECTRSSLFVHVAADASLGGRLFEASPAIGVTRQSDRWVARACEELWLRRPPVTPVDDLDGTREFLRRAWVHPQIIYHAREAIGLENRERRLAQSIGVIFSVTLVAALLHFFADQLHLDHDVGKWATYLTIALPALGAAIGGIRVQGEYERHADRSQRTVDRLREFDERLTTARDARELWLLASDCSQRLLEENRDWYDVMFFREIELHV